MFHVERRAHAYVPRETLYRDIFILNGIQNQQKQLKYRLLIAIIYLYFYG